LLGRLEADGVDRFIGRGVLYGAARTEAPTVAGKRVFIIGGGNSAGQAALFFADYASSVTMLIRGKDLKGTMSQYLIDQIALVPGIRVETETQVVSADGTDCLKAVETRKTGEPVIRRAADALFVMIGADAVTNWLPPQLQRENGYVRTGREVSDQPGWAADRAPFLLETNLPGFFCVGDVRYNSIKRFQQRRRRQYGRCFRAPISLVTAQTISRVIAVIFVLCSPNSLWRPQRPNYPRTFGYFTVDFTGLLKWSLCPSASLRLIRTAGAVLVGFD